jgi:hypothetical protein
MTPERFHFREADPAEAETLTRIAHAAKASHGYL